MITLLGILFLFVVAYFIINYENKYVKK